jgi:hypothetical protein
MSVIVVLKLYCLEAGAMCPSLAFYFPLCPNFLAWDIGMGKIIFNF